MIYVINFFFGIRKVIAFSRHMNNCILCPKNIKDMPLRPQVQQGQDAKPTCHLYVLIVYILFG